MQISLQQQMNICCHDNATIGVTCCHLCRVILSVFRYLSSEQRYLNVDKMTQRRWRVDKVTLHSWRVDALTCRTWCPVPWACNRCPCWDSTLAADTALHGQAGGHI